MPCVLKCLDQMTYFQASVTLGVYPAENCFGGKKSPVSIKSTCNSRTEPTCIVYNYMHTSDKSLTYRMYTNAPPTFC
jgi:hypothetical protein